MMLASSGSSEHAAHGRTSCPAASSSGSPSPGRWPAGPQLLIADEPTGQLDRETGRQIMRLLLTVVRSEGITALVATHDRALIDLADEVIGWRTEKSNPIKPNGARVPAPLPPSRPSAPMRPARPQLVTVAMWH